MGFAESGRTDARDLQAAKEAALALRDELLPQRRYAESCRLVMLAADATTLQGELESASELIGGALPEERDADAGRIVLADCALRAQDHATALDLLRHEASSMSVKAMRAQAEIHAGNGPERLAARAVLLRLFDAQVEDHVAERAALTLIFTAHQFDELPFPWAGCRLGVRARREPRTCDRPSAVAAPQRTVHRGPGPGQGTPARRLGGRARAPARRVGRRPRRRHRPVYPGAAHDRRRPHSADVRPRKLALAGDTDRAREVANSIAVDTSVPSRLRGDAYSVLVHVVVDRGDDHQTGLDLLRQWSEVVPEDRRHLWGRIQSMLRLGLHQEAIDLLLNTSVPIESRGEAMLAAQTYLLMPDREAGLTRLADLLDSLPARDPELERRAWVGLLRAGEDLPEGLVARLKPAGDFKIPGQQMTLDEMKTILRERHGTIDEVGREVMDGAAAVTKLAQVTGRELTSTWLALEIKPAGFGTLDWEQLDRSDADAALARGAVADPTALATLSLLPSRVRDVALRHLAGPLRVPSTRSTRWLTSASARMKLAASRSQ